MTETPRGLEPTPGSGPLARAHRALPDLARRLRAAGLRVGPDRWQNLYDLLLALSIQGRLPDRIADLQPLIGPLLVGSDLEQGQLAVLFAEWLQSLAPEERAAREAGGSEVQAESTRGPVVPGPRWRWPLLALLLALAAVLGGAYWWHWLHTPPVSVEPPRELAPPPDVEPPPSPEPESLELQPVPPRTPVPAPVLDRVHQSWHDSLADLCIFLPVFLALSWLLIRWLTWRTVLDRRQGRAEDPLAPIGLPAERDDLLDAPDLRETLKRLHNPIAVPTRRLDLDRTVQRTARCAGLFSPVGRLRHRAPDLVVLVESAHAGDQMAGLAGQLVERLGEAGLAVHRYEYRGSPRLAVGEDGRWRDLESILARHQGARLLLIGEPTGLVNSASGRPYPWLVASRPGPGRGLLSTRRPPRRWQESLATIGFAVAEIGSDGLRALAVHLSGVGGLRPVGSDADAAPLPRLLQDAARWSRPTPPAAAERDTLLASLDAYLGTDGAYLLAALAAYPQLHWGLTRVLDLGLFPAGGAPGAPSQVDPRRRERRLLEIARLPWSRRGAMPDWLREALLDRLEPQAERRMRRVYREILRQATTEGRQRIALPVSLPQPVGLLAGLRRWVAERGWRLDRWLAGLGALSPPHGALNDAIFADLLLGRRLRLLDFLVPRRLFARHLRGALHRAMLPRTALALVLAAGGAWLADRAWDAWLAEPARAWLMQAQNAMHRGYRVEILHRPGLAPLAEALRGTLADEGFAARIIEPGLALPEGEEPPPAPNNKVQWGDGDDLDMAQHIEQRLRYLVWGRDPEVTDKLDPWSSLPGLAAAPARHGLRVLLLSSGVTGSAFRDGLTRPLTAEQIQGLLQPPGPVEPEQQSPVKTEPAPEADAARADDLRGAIRRLEGEIAAKEVEMQAEEDGTGSTGRSGRGPVWASLQKERDSLLAEKRRLEDQLASLPGTSSAAGDGKARLFRDPLEDGGEGPAMVRLPGGSFLMGSPDTEPERSSEEGPRHRVDIRPFAMGRTEVTFADYDRFAEATGRERPQDNGWGRGDRPVINVSWKDAGDYATWLSDQTGQEYRLPSEAEWEYAARGGTDTPFWTGGCIDTDQANYDGNYDYGGCGAKTGLYRQQTLPAGSLPQNPFGLYDVAGNAWEWVADCWHDNYLEGAPADGGAWLESNGGDCARRVLRGGSWLDFPRSLRSAFRYGDTAVVANVYVGFRLARTLPY